MANKLFESYKGRLAIADRAYARTHAGKGLPESKKLVVAKCLENVNR